MATQQTAREAEHRFAVRIRIAVPPEGLGSQLAQMVAWLDANCGPGSWSIMAEHRVNLAAILPLGSSAATFSRIGFNQC
jgi:hypothetical protein